MWRLQRLASAAVAARSIPSAISSSLPLLPSASLLRRFSSSSSFLLKQKFSSLLSAANAAPGDVGKQYQLVKEANRMGEHAFVINRVDSGLHAANASVRFEYQKAMQAMRAQEVKAQQELQQQQQMHHQHQYQHQYQSHPPPYDSHSSSFPSSSPGSGPGNPVIIREVAPSINWSESFYGALPRIAVVLVLFGGYMWWKNRGGQEGGESASSLINPFGPPKDFLNREMSTVRFKDVKGCDEAKAELQEIVEFLKNPAKFERLGGKMTKGVLLSGEPGTGKTLLAKAVAGEAGVPFFAVAGSEFEEMYVGVGAKRVRELFAAARVSCVRKENESPLIFAVDSHPHLCVSLCVLPFLQKQKKAIIFIDEIDAVGGNRDRIMGSHGRATINALLTEMDGFQENSGIVVIGATNLDRVLDPALVRPGRFDRRVAVSLPDAQGRLDILQLYAGKMKLHSGVDLKLLSQTTSGMSGAELHNLLNTAAIRASAQGKSSIDHDEIEYAYDKILMGAERSFTQSAEVKANTAYHEAGHTIMLLNTPGAPDLHKVTILPRGRALGAMFFLPLNEHRILTKQQLQAHIDICMGGRVAEEFLSGKDRITSGASNDLEQASAKARAMVTQFGMGRTTGVFTLPEAGDGVNPAQVVAPETLKHIDEEVSRILKESYERTKSVIASHQQEWERLAQALIEHEALDAKQVMQAVRGEDVTRKFVNKYRAADAQPPPSDAGGVGIPPEAKPVPIVKA
jgi:ATP-dependent metalloprotease